MPINRQISLSMMLRYDDEQISGAEIEGRHMRALRKMFADEGVQIVLHDLDKDAAYDPDSEVRRAAERQKKREEAKQADLENARINAAPWVEKIRRMQVMLDTGEIKAGSNAHGFMQRIEMWVEEWLRDGEFHTGTGSSYSLYRRCRLGGRTPPDWRAWLRDNVMSNQEHQEILEAARTGKPMPPVTWEPKHKPKPKTKLEVVPDTVPEDWQSS